MKASVLVCEQWLGCGCLFAVPRSLSLIYHRYVMRAGLPVATHTRKHTHKHTHTRTHIHTQTHACTHSQTHKGTRIHSQMHTHRHTHTHAHANTQRRTHVHTQTHTHSHTPAGGWQEGEGKLIGRVNKSTPNRRPLALGVGTEQTRKNARTPLIRNL